MKFRSWEAVLLALVCLGTGFAIARAWGPHGVQPVPLVRCVDL